MGLPTTVLRYLIREHKRKPFVSPVATLGRQTIFATYQQVLRILTEEGLEPHGQLEVSLEGNCSDKEFFRLLGLGEIESLDVSDYEGASTIVNLNLPISQSLHERFNTIIDGGTLEHVFDIAQAIKSLSSMLKIGGRIVHMSPANNYCNHGFYQMSPTFFYDYYAHNSFLNLNGLIAEQDVYARLEQPLELYQLQPNITYEFTSKTRLMVFFEAQRGPQSSIGQIPIQLRYQPHSQAAGPKSRYQFLKELIPFEWKVWLQRILGLHPSRRPWRLRKAGRLLP